MFLNLRMVRELQYSQRLIASESTPGVIPLSRNVPPGPYRAISSHVWPRATVGPDGAFGLPRDAGLESAGPVLAPLPCAGISADRLLVDRIHWKSAVDAYVPTEIGRSRPRVVRF
jgi:hypothetical protein